MGLVRLFLALVVAADHWRLLRLPLSLPIDDQYKFGFNAGYAVMFFYIISGFLITYTLSRNYERTAAGIGRYYTNRFIRIYSLYWPLVFLSLAFLGGWAFFTQSSLIDKLTAIFLIGIDWNVAFGSYPQPHFAGIVGLFQAWTLGAELLFYIVAPLLMRSWKLGAALLALSFGLRAAFVIAWGPGLHDIWTYHFVATTFGFFMLGHLACLSGARWRIVAAPLLGVLMILASLAVMTFDKPYVNFDSWRFWISALLFTASLPGLFEATKSVRWMNLAGDCSYPIYLIHSWLLSLIATWLLSVTALPGWAPLDAAYLSIGVFVFITTAAAIVVHRVMEVPTAKGMHWIMDRLSAASPGRLASSRGQSAVTREP
jgi:peptidoglycan/LPS O-acetylase OafA/YrhL